jgi:chromosome segregation protein
VNEHFKKALHRPLFGGTAELVLTGSEDPLEAGLDIIAKPPGKKAQSLSLLSGGEQALTAMSLDFRSVFDEPVANLRPGRSRCAARRFERRALLQPA